MAILIGWPPITTPGHLITNKKNSRGQALLRNSDTELVKAYYTTYGNLYTYEEAVANAPAGWRLPTDEDWKN